MLLEQSGSTFGSAIDQVVAEMREGTPFEEVEICTTGDLEINVVGIGLMTGYVDQNA